MAEPTAEPSRDRGHEALRLDILSTVSDLQQNTDDTAVGLDLTDTLFGLIDGLYTQIDALQQRVAQLELPLAPP